MTDYDELVTISSKGSLEADLIKVYLEIQGISVFLLDQYSPHTVGAGAVKICVPQSQVNEAKRLLAEREET